MVRTRRQWAGVTSASPSLETIDSSSDDDTGNFRVVRTTSGEAVLNPQPVAILPPSSPPREGPEGSFPGLRTTGVGAPSTSQAGSSRRRRVIVAEDSEEEEEDPSGVTPSASKAAPQRGEEEMDEEELHPLWEDLARAVDLDGDDDDEESGGEPECGETSAKGGPSRGLRSDVNPGSAYIKKGIDMIKSIVTEAHLADLRKAYEIPLNVTLRVPSAKDLPSLPREGEIAITIPAFFYGLRVPFPAFLRRFFHLAPLHPIQLSPVDGRFCWEHISNGDAFTTLTQPWRSCGPPFPLGLQALLAIIMGTGLPLLCWRVWPTPRIGRRGGSSWVEHGKEWGPAPPGATGFLQTSMSSTGPRPDLPIPQVSLLGLTSCWT